MPSKLMISTGMTTAQLQAIADALAANGGAEVRIFAGNMPASANAGVGSAVLLGTVTGPDGEALGLEVDNALLQKDPEQVWTGDYVAAGRATFFRLCAADDTNAASTTLPRMQGTVGLIECDLNLMAVDAVVGQPVPIKEFLYSFREAEQG